MKSRAISYFGHYLALALFLLIQLFPFYWMVTTAFKSANESIRTPPMWFPESPRATAFVELFTERDFATYLKNSVLVCTSALVVTMAVSVIAAYGFARWNFPGKGVLLGLLIGSSMLPFISIVGPTFVIIEDARLLDTKLGLVLVFINGGIPLATWMMYTFLQTVPRELEEAASVDGANRVRIFGQIVLPLSTPGLASTAILTFISYWNELLFPLVLTLTPEAKTLTVGLSEIPGLFEIPFDLMAAAGTITAIPAVLLVVFFQRYLIQGIVAGAVK